MGKLSLPMKEPLSQSALEPEAANTTKQEVSCAQCEDWMGRVSVLLGTDVFANTVYNDLHGAVFCDDTTYVPAANTEECKGLMDLIGVKAVKALGTLLSVTASRICVDLGCTA